MARDENEEEAKRRCLNAGYSLEMEARNLTSFAADDARPLWRAHYLREVLREKEADARAKALVNAPAYYAMAFGMLSSPAFLATIMNFCFDGWW